MRERIAKDFRENFPQADIKKIWHVLSIILATNSAGSLFLERGQYHCILLKNKASSSFLTGDQSVVNTYGRYDEDSTCL
ncbi:MAG: hypothetical protein MI807_15435, partial [Verrucomicrobiales bacterium]|nr:hypothetical protein [Verrucomicrobiales bacterium]